MYMCGLLVWELPVDERVSKSLSVSGSQEEHISSKVYLCGTGFLYIGQEYRNIYNIQHSTSLNAYNLWREWCVGDILSHLPGVISLYFGISLILVIVIWEARVGMRRERDVQLYVCAQVAWMLGNSSNIYIFRQPWK